MSIAALPLHDRPMAGEAAFKLAMRALPGAVTIVAAQDARGDSHGLTATAMCSLSASPPSLLLCLNGNSALAQALKPGSVLGVNLPGADQVEIARAFGGMAGVTGRGKFTVGAWVRGEYGAPLLANARVAFECSVAEIIEHATHRIVIAAIHDVRIGQVGRAALLYHERAFRTLGGEAL